MAQLALVLCDHATQVRTEGIPEEQTEAQAKSTAKFVRCVLDAFVEILRGVADHAFFEHFQNLIEQKFSTYWPEVRNHYYSIFFDVIDFVMLFYSFQGYPMIIMMNNPTNGASFSLPYALALTSFVGDLFTEDVFHFGFVSRCLETLGKDVSVIEEVRAILALLTHCDAKLYRSVRLDRWVDRLAQSALGPDGVRDDASMTGEKFGRKELQALLTVSRSRSISVVR